MTEAEQKYFNERAWDKTAGNLEQFRVLMSAMEIFVERNARYNDVWKGSGWMGSLFDMRKKITRMWVTFWGRESQVPPTFDECDDAVDVINYAAFFIRNVHSNNRYGSWS